MYVEAASLSTSAHSGVPCSLILAVLQSPVMKALFWIALLNLPAAAISQTPPASDQTAATEAFRAGRAAMEQNDLTLAHAEFAKVVKLAPNVAAGHSALGAVLYAEGKPSAAVPELEKAHSLDPKDTT